MSGTTDLVIRGGTVVDGTGGDLRVADVAISSGRIVAVGKVDVRGREEIDAQGKIVTPGFVDIHTHYDGHATWSQQLNPSSAHGVTTVVMGNCGVGFAPCRPDDHDRLVRLMEGVEDIPAPVMTEGLPWNWESFPQYLDSLAQRSFDMDVAAYLPHAPLRVYVMKERGVAREKATPDDIAKMQRLAFEAAKAGAIGFSTSRSLNHKASDGSPTPSLCAAEDELQGIAAGLRAAGAGVLQMISDFDEPEHEFDMVERVAATSGRPLSLSLMQVQREPDRWRYLLERIEQANQRQLEIRAQVCGRPVGVLTGLELSFNTFSFCPSYKAISALPLAERVAAMRNPELRAKIISEYPVLSWEPMAPTLTYLDRLYVMDEYPEYEPRPEKSIAAQAAARGVAPAELAYDLLLQEEGKTIFYIPIANWAFNRIDEAEIMLKHPNTILGLGDGGAHCGLICDASLTTHMLTRWVNNNDKRTMPLQDAVRALTSSTTGAVKLADRGIIAPGMRADLNVIDLDRLRLHRPEMVYDLPKGGGRLHQRADGYDATIVAGEVTYRNGVATGALPGRLVRGPGAVSVSARH